MQQLSVIIITLNEERVIAGTIEAAQRFSDEIVVVDSGSTDRTAMICAEKQVRFISHAWEGYGPQRNFAVSQAQHAYILALDADEVPDEELIAGINQMKATGFDHEVYALQRRNVYYGKLIRYGQERSDWKLRLYHRDAARWDDKLVHESLHTEHEKRGRLPGAVLHLTYPDISSHVAKTNLYTELSAKQYFQQGKPEPGIVKLVLSPWFTFVKVYLLQLGFLDGWHGWVLARMHAQSVLLKYAKLKMLYRERSNAAKR